MKLKVGLKWKHTNGHEFVIRELTSDMVYYESKTTKSIYSNDRKHFEKYLKFANKYWSNKNKDYKANKEKLKRNEV